MRLRRLYLGNRRGHVRTDPACLLYRAPRPGSRRDRASRGRSCDYCMVLRRDFGVWRSA